MSVGIRAADAVTNAIDTAGSPIARARRGQRVLAIGALGILLLVGGCTKVGPDFVKPDAPIAEQWTETGELQLIPTENDHEDWWEAFKDPVLNKLVNEAYNQNLTLQIAGLRIVEARAQLGLAAGSAWPQQQQATLGATYSKPSDNTAGSAFLTDTWNYNTGLQIGWEIDFWGKFRRGIESADAALLASIADYDTVLVSLTADVANTYVIIRTFQERLAIARENVKIQERSLNIADVRFRNGATTELDVQQAKTLLFNTQASIPALEAGLRQSENALSILLGMPPGKIQQMLGQDGKIPAPPTEVAIGIPADLLRRRPDVRGAELQAAAQSALIGVAKADFYPSVALLGSIGLSATEASNTTASGKSGIGEWFTSNSLTYMGGPSVTWNIFNYGQISNNVRTQDARLQQLLVNYQNVVLQAAQEVEDSTVGFVRTQEQERYLSQSVISALRSVDLAVIQYRDGAVDYTRVLNSQQSLITQQDQATVTRGQIAQNLVGMYRALGGGWQLRAGRDFIPEATKDVMSERTNWGNILTPEDQETLIPPSTTPDDSYRWPRW
ncbi:MAG: efflux transporter outer membrane subunit [Gammaproteobacteria bacterium]|nr:efflux transporter outer membrane subunit [Gammaproteobacteria bacterium]MDX2459692.1 efflux transporter outer membrane subunit [Gammaproteobacteria bacterium]